MASVSGCNLVPDPPANTIPFMKIVQRYALRLPQFFVHPRIVVIIGRMRFEWMYYREQQAVRPNGAFETRNYFF